MPNSANKKPIVWTIAGSDSGGGAGIQADLLTFQDFKVHGCSVITALTAQNSFAVGHVQISDHKMMAAQINALDSDLMAKSIKLGMLADSATAETVAKYLQDYPGFVVCDPVMVATSGGKLLDDAAVEVYKQQIIPRADVLTPNIAEAEELTGIAIGSYVDMVAATNSLLAMGARSVLIKGGHFDEGGEDALDYWSNGKDNYWIGTKRIDSIHTHGSGCSLSSAIAAAVAQGYSLLDALVLAKAYVTQGIRAAGMLGSGPGAVAHCGWPESIEDLPYLYKDTPRLKPLTFESCNKFLGLYPVVDSVEWIDRLSRCGVKTIQLRMKDQAQPVLRAAIREAVAICKAKEIALFINDHWELAIEEQAYGVHLGQEDLQTANLEQIAAAGLRLGTSNHCYSEIAISHGIKPSYIALGPVYATTTKEMVFEPLGIQKLQQWVDLLSEKYPLTAIGGINLERADDVLWTGVGSCAVVTAVTEAEDIDKTVSSFTRKHLSSLTVA